MGLFGFGKKEKDKMKDGLEKTRTGFWGNILNTLTGSKIDDDLYDELEEQLILADVGGDVAMKLVDALRDRVQEKGLKTGEQAADALRDIIADDSGLCVDALDGAPGVYSARYCGHHGDDEANNDKLLEKMKDVPAGQRGAKFVAAVCFILPTGQHLTCRGECPGRVAFERLAGDYGFGYDPLFIPDECGVGKTDKRPNSEGRSYAQLTPDEKDAISHRGNALAEMEKELPEFLKKAE